MLDDRVATVHRRSICPRRRGREFVEREFLEPHDANKAAPPGFAPERDGRSGFSSSLGQPCESAARVVRAAARPLLLTDLDRALVAVFHRLVGAAPGHILGVVHFPLTLEIVM